MYVQYMLLNPVLLNKVYIVLHVTVLGLWSYLSCPREPAAPEPGRA